MKTPEGKAVLKIYMQNSLFSLTENEIDFYKLCICIIKQYELDIKNEYILSDMQTEGFMIQVSWIRSLKGYTIKLSDDEKNALTGTLSYRSVENSVEKMWHRDGAGRSILSGIHAAWNRNNRIQDTQGRGEIY